MNGFPMQQLVKKGDFLSLSRTQPELFKVPSNFSLENGTDVSISAPGIIQFSPSTSSATTKHIVLSSGVHGNETAPIEICDELVSNILTGKLALSHRVLFLFGNLPAMDIAQRFVDENMNRLFSGAHSEGEGCTNQERKRAKVLEEAVTQFFSVASVGESKYHYDLHTAIRGSKNEKFAVYPFLHGKPYSQSQLAFLAACNVKTILLSESRTTTFSYYSSYHHDAFAFTVELGKVQPFGQNDMSKFKEAKAAICQLISEADFAPDVDINTLDIYRVNQVINKNEKDFKLHFADDALNFTDFEKGTLLASETGANYIAEYDGEAIVFPNANVAIGQRALLTVVPTTLDNLNV